MMARLLVALVRGYQLLLGGWLPPACRFQPSCSAYAIGALNRHGALAGTYLAARRLVRCGPWCMGGDDPVPDREFMPESEDGRPYWPDEDP